MSIGGGVHMAIERGCSINCTAIQMFVKNNMQWFARPLTRDEIRAFLEHRDRGNLLSIFAHANYLINLATTNCSFTPIQSAHCPRNSSAAINSNCHFSFCTRERISVPAKKVD